MKRCFILWAFLFIFSFVFQSCIIAADAENAENEEELFLAEADISVIDKLLEGADWAKGRSSLVVRGRQFNMDCTGVVCAVYYYAGIDLTADFGKYQGNGVKRIHQYLEANDLLYPPSEVPFPGDILFWDNTYDFNKNGEADDLLTHIGMVVSADRKTGEAFYIHYNYSKGIIFEKINLLKPDSEKNNSPIRMKNLPKVKGYKYLSSQLLHDAGRGYLIR